MLAVRLPPRPGSAAARVARSAAAATRPHTKEYRNVRLRTAWIGFVSLGVLAGGCAMQQKKVESQLASSAPAPVNCATADGDLRVLQSEKANVAERIAEGATAIYPAGLVLGILTGTETTKLKVAVGDYDALIDRRITEIQTTCGIQQPSSP
jgi:hypothetical protein